MYALCAAVVVARSSCCECVIVLYSFAVLCLLFLGHISLHVELFTICITLFRAARLLHADKKVLYKQRQGGTTPTRMDDNVVEYDDIQCMELLDGNYQYYMQLVPHERFWEVAQESSVAVVRYVFRTRMGS